MLEKLQNTLTDQVTDMWYVMADDLPLDKEAFENHFKDLGYYTYKIQKYDSLKNLIAALYNGEFDALGYCDESDIDELLEYIFTK